MLSIIFIIIAGIFNAFMDLSAENLFDNDIYNKSKGSNNDENKWKQPLQPGKKIWWYLWLKKPLYKEKFIWSSTFFVFLTDWWHKFQYFMIIFFSLSIVFYNPISLSFIQEYVTQNPLFLQILSKICDVLILSILFGFSFEMVYAPYKKKLLK